MAVASGGEHCEITKHTYANNTLFLSVPTISAAGRVLAASLYRVLK
jgi:hypothetical protein